MIKFNSKNTLIYKSETIKEHLYVTYELLTEFLPTI